ncbi:MAG TPA: hypothetical protein VFQ35_05350 [Polyangiaceae bacterium]|nr:hypothetical protein [Polyangiaceae bacterium]
MKNLLLKTLVSSLALGALFGCEEAVDPGSRVTSLRVMAQRMDAPYAAPGETVHVESLALEPAGRPVNWAWALCENPVSTDVEGCIAQIASDGPTQLMTGTGLDTVDVTVPADALSSLPAAARPSATVGVLSVACPGNIEFAPGKTGYPFRCSDAESGRELALNEFVVGLKRIAVRAMDRNQNPSIEGITFDGADWPEDLVPTVTACKSAGNDFADCDSGFAHKIRVQVTPESFETGRTEFGEEFSEQLVVQYFATEGIFESDARTAESPENKWAARAQSVGRDVNLWFVARDNRGGVTWASRRVHDE